MFKKRCMRAKSKSYTVGKYRTFLLFFKNKSETLLYYIFSPELQEYFSENHALCVDNQIDRIFSDFLISELETCIHEINISISTDSDNWFFDTIYNISPLWQEWNHRAVFDEIFIRSRNSDIDSIRKHLIEVYCLVH